MENEIMENVAETVEEVALNVEDIPASNGTGVGVVLAIGAAVIGVIGAACYGVMKWRDNRKAKKENIINFEEELNIPGEGDEE